MPDDDDDDGPEEPSDFQAKPNYDIDDRSLSEKIYDFVDEHGPVVLGGIFGGFMLLVFVPLMAYHILSEAKAAMPKQKAPPENNGKEKPQQPNKKDD